MVAVAAAAEISAGMQRLDAEEHCQKQPEYPEDYPTTVASEEKGEPSTTILNFWELTQI